MKLKPLFDRVLLKLEGDQFNRTSSGIILGATSSEMPVFALVVAVGNGKVEAGENLQMQVMVGDRVLYNKFAGTEVLIDSITHVIIKQTDILAIVE